MELGFDVNHLYDFCVPIYSLVLTKYPGCIQAVDMECDNREDTESSSFLNRM